MQERMKLFLISLLFLPLRASTQLKVAKIFSGNMLLQRDKPVNIWGKGLPGKEVIVSFGNENKCTVVKADSSWLVSFKKQKANRLPQSISIRSVEDSIELKNILVGDLWLCIGQSNMQWPLSQEMHFRSEVEYADQPLLRFYDPTYAGEDIYNSSFTDSVISRLNTNDFYKGEWQQSDSNTAKSMSAVGYYFGKTILNKENVPVGLIDLAIGGAPIETFISKATLQSHSGFAEKTKANWLNNPALPVWIRERAQQNISGKDAVEKDELGANHPFKPGFAFTSGIEPILDLPVKGIIWYQGESNADRSGK
jgi:sialate O-acetylesterase